MINLRALAISSLVVIANPCYGMAEPDSDGRYCGTSGVWIQVLGAGGAELDDRQAGSSFVVWIDDHARLLVDTGPGSAAAFDRARADFTDLDAIAFTHLHADHSSDFPAFVAGSRLLDRKRPLPVLGPAGNDEFPDTETFVERMIGREGAYPYLSDFLTYRADAGYKINARNVPATGQRRWSRFGTQYIRLSAIPVNHANTPAVAWRVEASGQVIVFAGDFNNEKNVIPKFAEGADALVVSHAIPETARGNARDRYAIPSQLGSVAKQANVRMLILAHRMNRTRGRETQSRTAIEEHYTGPLIFANDMECWGL